MRGIKADLFTQIMCLRGLWWLFNAIAFCRQIEKLRNCELITEKEVKQLCAKARQVQISINDLRTYDTCAWCG